MVDIIKCEKAAVYHNTARLSPAKIKAKTGCSHIINGYLFNKSFKPCAWLVINGKVISSDEFRDYGFACNTTGAPVMSTDRTKSFLSGCPILKDGNKLYRNLTPDVARTAERTAVAWTKEGHVILWCDKMKLTRNGLQDKLLALGAVDALMLDGGGSTQGIFPSGTVTSSRKVTTLLLFWDGIYRCPYAEPAKNIRRGSIGTGAKWVQWQLNRHGASLTIDGIFGKSSVAALMEYQKRAGLDADSICGKATRVKLKE